MLMAELASCWWLTQRVCPGGLATVASSRFRENPDPFGGQNKAMREDRTCELCKIRRGAREDRTCELCVMYKRRDPNIDPDMLCSSSGSRSESRLPRT